MHPTLQTANLKVCVDSTKKEKNFSFSKLHSNQILCQHPHLELWSISTTKHKVKTSFRFLLMILFICPFSYFNEIAPKCASHLTIRYSISVPSNIIFNKSFKYFNNFDAWYTADYKRQSSCAQYKERKRLLLQCPQLKLQPVRTNTTRYVYVLDINFHSDTQF